MQDSERDDSSPPRRSHQERRSTHDASLEADGSEYETPEMDLPSHGLLYALIIGVLGGLLATAISVAITFINASLYQQASRLGDKMPLGTAWTLTELGCLEVFIALILSFAAGYIVGRLAVLRRWGLLAGALVGGVTYLGNAIVLYLPNYPNKIVSATTPSSGQIFAGILISLVIFLIYSAIGALISLWGARTATRKHPYYQQ
jgi:hypothetical protein